MVKIFIADDNRNIWPFNHVIKLHTTQQWMDIPHSERWDWLVSLVKISTEENPLISICSEPSFVEACEELCHAHNKRFIIVDVDDASKELTSTAQLKNNTALDFYEKLTNLKLTRAFTPRNLI